MGDTGPCGPCSEIFFDHGPEVAGGPPGSAEQDGDRYIEVWNNVFMQFNRTEDGVMHKLPKPSVDTGMGLERLAAVLQHVHSNYEIDMFVRLLAAAKAAVQVAAGGAEVDATSPSLKVIADHIRACTFTVVDGVIPGNEGRGYVLRRIMRRAMRHATLLGAVSRSSTASCRRWCARWARLSGTGARRDHDRGDHPPRGATLPEDAEPRSGAAR